MEINCNEIPQISSELKMKFESCKVLKAEDLDLLVDLVNAIADCTIEGNISQNNIIIPVTINDSTNSDISTLVNNLSEFTVNDTEIYLFKVINTNTLDESIYLFNPGKGTYGNGSNLTNSDFFFLNTILQTNDIFLNSISLNNTTLKLELNDGTIYSQDLASINRNTYAETLTYNNGTLTITMSDGSNISENISELINNPQVKSDILETDNTNPAFIENKNPQKVVNSTSYTVTSADNNYVILVDTTSSNITIDVDMINNPLPSNFFVGFIQKGSNKVSFTGDVIIPTQFQNTLIGEGHNAGIEVFNINGTDEAYLTGSLNETP